MPILHWSAFTLGGGLLPFVFPLSSYFYDSTPNIPYSIYLCIQQVLDFMIAFRFNQSDTERAGRTMTLTKPALRSSLGDEHFKQA